MWRRRHGADRVMDQERAGKTSEFTVIEDSSFDANRATLHSTHEQAISTGFKVVHT